MDREDLAVADDVLLLMDTQLRGNLIEGQVKLSTGRVVTVAWDESSETHYIKSSKKGQPRNA